MMQSKLAQALRLAHVPVAVLLTNDRPAEATQLKEGKFGCVGALMQTAAGGRTVVADRRTFGCSGGGTGLGFGDCYTGFPIRQLLSTGGQAVLGNGATRDMGEGERFHRSPEITDRWTAALPYRQVPTEYVVMKPLPAVGEGDAVSLVFVLANADQLSALVTLAGFRTGEVHATVSPWGGACQSILFAYAESERDPPRGVIGFFDIAQRHRIDRDLLSFTMPYALFVAMEADVDASFLRTEAWRRLEGRL